MNKTVQSLQRRLIALGFPLPKYGADGDPGGETIAAVNAALDEIEKLRGVKPSSQQRNNAPLKSSTPQAAAITSMVILQQPKASRPIKEIVVHCTATPEGRDVSVDTIRSWHVGQGWKDIGYHYVVMLDGTVEPGRPEEQIGSHVAGHNTGTLGIVYVGGVSKDGKTPKDTRTPAQKAALMDLTRALIAKYPTIKKVTGHNQYSAKACPSFDVRKDPLSSLVD
ncbi:N-acetylmuramoyl-L-alanine amidase [Sinorhizobium medicae]